MAINVRRFLDSDPDPQLCLKLSIPIYLIFFFYSTRPRPLTGYNKETSRQGGSPATQDQEEEKNDVIV